jgi:hypothetical protein
LTHLEEEHVSSDLHCRATAFDGLVVSNFSREVFEDMHAGATTAAN